MNTNEQRTWTCKDGRVLAISEMSDDHLKNCVAMLRRKGFIGLEELNSIFAGIGTVQGDMAQMAVEHELMEAASRPVSSHLDWLEEELEKRGLA